MVPVPAYFIKVALRHIRGFGKNISALSFLVFHESAENLEKSCAFRHKKRQSLTYDVRRHEIAKVASDFIMVAQFRLLQRLKIILKLRFLFERRTVNTRKHLILFVAFKIRARYLCEFEIFNFARRRHMRSAAKVRKLALSIKSNYGIGRQFLNKLNFINLSSFLHESKGFITGNFPSFERIVRFDYSRHLLLDCVKIVFSYRLIKIYVVIKSV